MPNTVQVNGSNVPTNKVRHFAEHGAD